MLFELVIALMLLVGASAGTLHEVFSEKVRHYGDLEQLKSQLSLVLDGSRDLLETRTAVQGLNTVAAHPSRQLRGNRLRSRLDEIIHDTLKSLEVMARVAESHSILAVLSRRTFLACVALQWTLLGQKPFDKEVEQQLEEMTAEFYRIHVMSVLRRGLMEYLHISKSGGTSFSAAAKHSNCRMAPGIGQLESLGDLPRWINGTAFEEVTGGTDIMWSWYSTKGRPAEGQSCARRLAHVAAAGYSYVSNEFTMHGGDGKKLRGLHVCPQVVNVVTLRNPDGRLPSHLHYMLARIKKRLLGKADFDAADIVDTFCSGDVRLWERMAPTVVDNYGVRSFVGEHAFHSPVGAIGHEHVDVARRLLLQFDLVMDLDAGEEAADLVIQQGLGWNISMAEVHVRTSSQTFSKLNYSKEECPNEELLGALLPRQGPDRLMYGTGRTLAFLDGVFLGVARERGLRPHDVAADLASGAVAAAAAAGKGAVNGVPPCGLLHAPTAAAATATTGRHKAARDSASDDDDDYDDRRARLLRDVAGAGAVRGAIVR